MGNLKEKLIVFAVTFSFFGSLLGAINLFSTPVLAEQGGPDEFGYVWTDSNAPSPTVTYDWVDAITGTELVWIDGSVPGDDMFNYTELPFPFEFYGVKYTSIYVNLNGAIDFGEPNIVHDLSVNKNIPDPAEPNNHISVFWDDLQIFDPANQKVTIMEGGAAPERYFVIEWYRISFSGRETTQLTFEIVLYEMGSIIKFQYQQIESTGDSGNNGAEATVGIENQNGSFGLLYSYNEQKLQNGLALEIKHPEYEFDTKVDNFFAPSYVITGSSFYVNSTVTNRGDHIENIEVNLTVNGALEDQIYLYNIAPNESANVNFNYTPILDGEYTVKIETTPLAGEIFTFNNNQWGVVDAFTPTHYLLVDKGHGNNLINLDTLFNELFLYRYWVNYTHQSLTSATLYGYDMLLCLRPSTPYSPTFEVPAIRSFVEDDGGDIFVLAGWNRSVLNGLTSSWSNISWDGPAPTSANRLTNNIALHPIGEDIEELYYTDQNFSLNRGTGAYEIVTDYMDSTLLGAADRVSWGKIFAVNGPGDFNNSRIGDYDAKRYLENIFEWLLRPVEINEVGLWDFYVPDVSLPSTDFYINATLTNYGSSEQSSVDLYLLIDSGIEDTYSIGPLPIGASESVSFTYNHGVEKTILVELIAWLPGDSYPQDNNMNKTVVITSLIVVGWTYGDSDDFNFGLEDIMESMLINYDPEPSGNGSRGPTLPLWNYPFIIIDGNGAVKDKEKILDAAFNGSIVVVNYNTFEQLLYELNYPNVFSNISYGFNSRYIFIGGGLIVESDFSNDGRLAEEWRYYSTERKDDLALHLSELLNILLRNSDITVFMMIADPYAITGLTIFINATVYNAGTNIENAILVNFSVDSIVTDSYTIPTLTNGSWEIVNFTWAPPSGGTYTLNISAAVQSGEVYDTNNYQLVSTRAFTPTNYILVDSGHSTQTMLYKTLLEDQRDRNFWINYSKIIDPNILSKHDVFLSLNPGSAYTVGELNALKTFLNNGGGLFVIGGSNQTTLDELTSYANLTWSGIALYLSDYSQNILTHDATSGIERVYYTSAPFSLETNGIAGPVIYDSTNTIVISAYSVYGQGKVFTLTGEHDLADDYLSFDENLNYSRNIMDWLFAPLKSNDTSITNFELKSLLKLNEEVYLNATLSNIGLNTENDVIVNLTINGSFKDSKTISLIAPGESVPISFTWAPLYEDNYTIRIEAQSVLGETNLDNNYLERNVYAMDFWATVLIDQTHKTEDITSYSIWTDALAQEGIGIETHYSGPITSEVLSAYGAFISIQPSSSYTSSELQAIRDFVQNGGGLMVIGDDNEQVCTELTGFAQMNWANGGFSGRTTDITPHQITIGVESIYLGAPVAQVILTGPNARGLIRDSTGQNMLVICQEPGRVASWVDENTLDDGYIKREDNKRAAVDVVKWILGVSSTHDLALSPLDAPLSMRPGDMVYVNTTVWNLGTNDEIDIYVNLSIEGQLNDTRYISFLQNGSSAQVSFPFALTDEGTYYPTLRVTVVPGETIVYNNEVNKTLWVRYVEGIVLFEQGHGCNDISKFQEIIKDIETIGFNIKTNSAPVNGTILKDNAVYVIPNPKTPFSGSEITAIQNFIANGGGLWVIGDERTDDVLSPLTMFAGINWTSTNGGVSGTAEEITSHKVTENISNVEIAGTIAQIIIESSDAMGVVNLSTGVLTMCAVSEPSGYSGRVAGFTGEGSMEDSGVIEGDNLQLAENIITWVGAIATANLPPKALGIEVQINEVLRDESILIYTNGEDIESSEDALEPYFEYRDPNESSWNTTYLRVVRYIGTAPSGYWQVEFKPPVDALLGFYDFRVQFKDTKGAYGNYSYANDSVEVRNNNPVAEDLTLEGYTVIRTQSVFIYANAFDLENPENQLTPEFRYKNESGSWDTAYFTGTPTYTGDFWETEFTPPIEAMLGLYDIRVRFIDIDGNYSGWFYLNDSLEVQNNPPLAIDIHSSSLWVFRGQTIFLYSNATDTEDNKTQLIPSIQHRSQSGEWADDYLSDPVYDTNVEVWRINFTPELSAELGTYDFRVWFTDSDFNISDYLTSYALVEVLNSQPITDNITVPSFVARGSTGYIYANATDPEDPESSLIPYFYYKVPNSSIWEQTLFSAPYYDDVLEVWVVSFLPPITALLGSYEIRVQIKDLDLNISDWVSDSTSVINNPPTTSDLNTSAPTLYRTESITIKVKASDVEDADSDLEATFQYKYSSAILWQSQYLFNLQYIYTGDWTVEFTPPFEMPLGNYDFRVRFRDNDGDYGDWEYKNGSVEIKNRLPNALDITLLDTEALRGETLYLFANGEDYEDAESALTACFEYKDPVDESWENASLVSSAYIDNQWRITFTPFATSSLGAYTFRVRFIDTDGDYSDWVYANGSIEVKNNPPVGEILTEKMQSTLTVAFSASVFDVEDSNLSFRWDFGDGEVSTEEGPTHTYEEPGTYTVYLNVTDSDGGKMTYVINLVIKIGDGDEGKGFDLIQVLLIIIPIIIAVIIIILYLSKRMKKEVIPLEAPSEEEVLEFEEVPPEPSSPTEEPPKKTPPPPPLDIPEGEKPELTEEIKNKKLPQPASSKHVTEDTDEKPEQ